MPFSHAHIILMLKFIEMSPSRKAYRRSLASPSLFFQTKCIHNPHEPSLSFVSFSPGIPLGALSDDFFFPLGWVCCCACLVFIFSSVDGLRGSGDIISSVFNAQSQYSLSPTTTWVGDVVTMRRLDIYRRHASGSFVHGQAVERPFFFHPH